MHNIRGPLGIGLSVILFSLVFVPTVHAQENADAQPKYDFTIIEGDNIQTDPAAQKILENIEIAKKRLAEMMAGGKPLPLTEHQKFIEEQRKISQEKLQTELDRINKK